MKTDDRCIPCTRELSIIAAENLFARYTLPALIIGIMIFFVDFFEPFQVLLPFLGLIIFFPIFTGTKYVRSKIYRNIPKEQTITHSLKLFRINRERPNIGEGMYYDRTMEIFEEGLNITKEHRQIVIYYLVEYVILSNNTRKGNYLEIWAAGLNLEKEELLAKMFEYTNIDLAFGYEKGKGILPELWDDVVDNKELRNLVLNIIKDSAMLLDDASQSQRQFFLEDLYLIEDELLEYVKENPDLSIIAEILETFEPETPPKNFLESISQQAAENQRMLEERRQKDQNKPNK